VYAASLVFFAVVHGGIDFPIALAAAILFRPSTICPRYLIGGVPTQPNTRIVSSRLTCFSLDIQKVYISLGILSNI
jgi:hypothetical protein